MDFERGLRMKRILSLAIAPLLAMAIALPASRADTIKVGVIGPLSGPFTIYGRNFQWGIEAYVAAHGDKVGDHKIEFVYRDLEAPNPAKASELARELIVSEKVQYLAGVYFSPNALAIAPLLESAKTPFVIFNAATSAIVQKSPYIVRTSFTMWQNAVPAAKVARSKGANKVIIAVSNYAPGLDAEAAFKKTFEAEGGTVVDSLRLPLNTTDFSPIMQRVKESGADSIFTFLPAGPPTLGFLKAYLTNGLKDAGIKIFAPGDLATEPDLPAIGDAGLGLLTTYNYSAAHKSAANEEFLALTKKIGANPDQVTMAAVAAFDGTKLIYKMIEATNGQQDPDKAVAAVKGMEWESPRGPVSIDPETRHIRQNIYLRELVKEDGKIFNKEIETFPNQPDWALQSK
jgi:branched-chain amino acid transport system substrate-binding protein